MVIGNCIRKMLGATSVMSSVADSCSWRAGLTTQLGYLLVSSFGQLGEPRPGVQAGRSVTGGVGSATAGGAGALTGTNTRSR